MSARDELLAIYPLSTFDDANRRIVERGVDQLLDEHAHELAEKQRAEQGRLEAEEKARFDGPLDYETVIQGEAVRKMADLIDPEVLNSE